MGRPIGAEEDYQCGLVNCIVKSQQNTDVFDERLITEVRLWAKEMSKAAPWLLGKQRLPSIEALIRSFHRGYPLKTSLIYNCSIQKIAWKACLPLPRKENPTIPVSK